MRALHSNRLVDVEESMQNISREGNENELTKEQDCKGGGGITGDIDG